MANVTFNTFEQLEVLSAALTQFIDNQPENEPASPEAVRAQKMLDVVDAAIVKHLETTI